jgi:transposase, IS30 family
MKNRGQLTALERDKIAAWLALKIPLRDIGRRLDRSPSTISDEVKRNSVRGEYRAIAADQISRGRLHISRRQNSLKNQHLFAYVVQKLRSGWTPEEIAGRLKRSHKGKTVICHETIYTYIYSEKGKRLNLAEYLVRHHSKRYHWHGRSVYHRGIPNRVSIHDRPEEINLKTTFGHWETDIVEGRNHQGGIQTMLERKTRYFKAKLIPTIDSEYGIKAQMELLINYPKEAAQSVTMDNGKENFNHESLHILGIKTYFCDPYSSWQKGSNENHNGRLRRYVPKKTDFSKLTQTELNAITTEMNHTPRKCLGFMTPFEAFKRELKCLSSS